MRSKTSETLKERTEEETEEREVIDNSRALREEVETGITTMMEEIEE
jgi:hypothetical protein